MKWIVIDLGSTNTKAAILDLEKNTVADYVRFPVNAERTIAEYIYEIHGEDYFQEIYRVIVGCLSKIREPECGIRISTQMHGFILTDEKGVPVTPYISWQDRRSQRMAETESDFEGLKRKLNGGLKPESGSALKTSSAVSNLYSMIIRGELNPRKRMRVHTLGSYMIHRLCGAYCTHITNACPLGTANVKNQQWDQQVIGAAGLENWSFPAIVDTHAVVGDVRIQGKRLFFYPDIGDQQAAVLGAMGDQKGEININIATAGQVSRVMDHFLAGEFETRPFFEATYLNTFTGLPAGRNLQVLTGLIQEIGSIFFKQELTEENIYQRISNHLSNQNIKSTLKEKLDFFQGKGAIWGITADNWSVAELYLGAYQELAAIYRERIEKLNRDGRASCAVATGGVLEKNEILYRMFQESCPISIRRTHIKDAVVAGHSRLAMVDEGMFPSVFEAGVLNSKLQWI